jgi:hypothetical protein
VRENRRHSRFWGSPITVGETPKGHSSYGDVRRRSG